MIDDHCCAPARAMIAPTLSPPPPPTPGRTGAEQVEEPSTKITKRVTAGAVEIQPAVGHPPDANRPAGFSAVTPGHPQDVDDITAWVDSGAPLHVNSRVGQAIQADGSRVSTGEGYDASAEASAGSTSGSLTAGVSSLRIHAEDLMCFPPQFPLDSGGGLLGKLGNRLAPRFADRHFERRYQEHRGQGLDSVQLYFAGALACFTATLWVYHLTSPHGFDRQSQVGLSLTNCALLVAVFFWAVLRFHPRLRARSSAVHALQITMLITLFSWGLPATARETCSDAYNTFDSNLHQTVFTCLLYGAVFCRVGTSAFAVVCLVALVNMCGAATPIELQPLQLNCSPSQQP